MVLVLSLAILGVCASVGAVIASMRDARTRVPTLWGYDTRHPSL